MSVTRSCLPLAPGGSPWLSVAVNSTSSLGVVYPILEQAALKFASKAYWHWYAACGVEEDEFLESLESVRSAVVEYNSLARR
jgi:hypothetical protein